MESGCLQLLSYAQVHVIDAEVVDLPHDEARHKIQNLPFVHTHSMHHHGWYDSLLLPNHDVTSRKLEMIQQYLMAARCCNPESDCAIERKKKNSGSED